MRVTAGRRATFLAAALLAAAAAHAQYKYVGSDGRVTYSDLPPPSTARVLEQKPLGITAAPAMALPFEVQQATDKYPVTLYTGNDCAPCDSARLYLLGRGVPFTEKTVTSDDDIALFRQQSPDGTAPVVTVGARRTIGYSQVTLAGLLDSAGYPSTSALPRDYQNAAATPLSPTTRPAAVQALRQATTASPGKAAADAAPPAQPQSQGTPGFRF